MVTFSSNNSHENRRRTIKSWIYVVETSSGIKQLNDVYIRDQLFKNTFTLTHTGRVRVAHLPNWKVFTFRSDSLLGILLIALKYLSFMRSTAAQQLLLHVDKYTKQETVCCFPHQSQLSMPVTFKLFTDDQYKKLGSNVQFTNYGKRSTVFHHMSLHR